MGSSVSRIVRKLLLLCFLVPGCALLRTPKSPIDAVWYRNPAENRSTLVVLLPGRYDTAECFSKEGFIDALRAEGISADVVAVDAHLGYYWHRCLVTRIRTDIIEPAVKLGYRHIWMAGISLGGFGALWYDKEQPGVVERLVLLSPYLGNSGIAAEVAAAGGIRRWDPPVSGPEDIQREIWRLLKVYEQPERVVGRVFLGYGLQDQFAGSNGLLAQLIPPSQVITVRGGHDWATWRELWRSLLEKPALKEKQ
jgi:pimeloyl-ACP methyl ester carboxylesterase